MCPTQGHHWQEQGRGNGSFVDWVEDPSILHVPVSPAHVGYHCGLLPFQRGGSRQRHARTGDAGWVQPHAASKRRLLSVFRLLNQTQRAFRDSARARSGITHRLACSGQRHA